MFRSIELFAGAGGLALGLEQAGFQHIGLIEFDKAAAETLKTNRPNWNVLCEDIAETAKRDLEAEFNIKKGELDLLSGGAPCQSFSYAGKRLGLDDIRGTMFYHYATFLHKLQPKIFLFENVKGLLTHNKSKTYKTIIEIFGNEGYTIYHNILNSWDYGVPQKRERLITIGIRNDLINKCSYNFPKPYEYKPLVRDIKLDVNPSKEECAFYSKSKADVFALVPPGGYWKDIDPVIAKKYMKTCWDMEGGRTGILRRISLDEPSLTVLTNPGMKQTDRCHPLEVRPFSYRENARFQTFPDEWQFCGTLSQKYKQVGNAVPVNLAKEVGLSIVKALNELGGVKMSYNIDFISHDDLVNHVTLTIHQYGDKLKSFDISRFNKNIIDPIKLLFDKEVYKADWQTIISNEIFRQRDKSNNNDIGYFHQRIFQYVDNCIVPANGDQGGWDVIFNIPEGIDIDGITVHTVYVEMKNKHNTMNSSSSQRTYIKMQNQIIRNDDCACFLVEAISKHSQNIKWNISIDGSNVSHKLIRKVSIDKFYEIVTGESDAFYRLCCVLPDIIKQVVNDMGELNIPNDTAYSELLEKSRNLSIEDDELAFAMAIYMLGFSEYNGFNK